MMSLKASIRRTLDVGGQHIAYFDLKALAQNDLAHIGRMPFCLKILLENMVRNSGRNGISDQDVLALANWKPRSGQQAEVAFHPARVLMQDYTGVPGLVDLAAMRSAMQGLGDDASRVNPLIPVDLVIDHSLIVDEAGHAGAFNKNLAYEYQRNTERYRFLKWAQQAFNTLRVVPPGSGILHQVNLEHVASVVRVERHDGGIVAFPDTMVGTDSHSTMINALGVLGWGVGGIEAEAAMLGLPLAVSFQDVVGVRLTGRLRPGVTATDLVLTLTQRLRSVGVVDKLIEFTGPSLDELAVADRATIANMAPEYGSTCAFFPIDQATLDYLRLTGREESHVALIKAYCQAQGLWREAGAQEPDFNAIIPFDLGDVEPCAAGPRRPQDRVPLHRVPENFRTEMQVSVPQGSDGEIRDGAVVIAAITSCTNTSNPAVMIAAGLVARKAVALGLKVKPWVKTSLTPGSRVVGGYLEESGLQGDLDRLGFQVAGYGCATCGGNSGQLAPWVDEAVRDKNLVVCSVLSGNRNFEARIHPLARANYLMSPPLVVAYALTGRVTVDLTREPVGTTPEGRPVLLQEIWPTSTEIAEVLGRTLSPDLFRRSYAELFVGEGEWTALSGSTGGLFPWDQASTYIRCPPYFDGEPSGRTQSLHSLVGARPLLLLGDSITTDHISPVSDIPANSPAGRYLTEQGVSVRDFNAYGARRANHEVMVRGTFANIRLRNEMVPGIEGGFTRHQPSGDVMPVFEAAARYASDEVPLVVIAGKEYGTGSSRDWAAKGTRLLGVRVVIAESFERIHRANLASMGVLPLQLLNGVTRSTLGLDGTETFEIDDMVGQAQRGAVVECRIIRTDGSAITVPLKCRLDSESDVQVWRAGGILPFVLRRLLSHNEQS
ncbi:aconitate hydratase AcnA [Microvirga sp. TS319]|uniref:aconitate hydratase AcnA n=1 Tax=Microvirga sp. TS319 TaxID=3241165 RepID=UPI00351A8528